MIKIQLVKSDVRRYLRALNRIDKVATREVTENQQMRSAIDYRHRLTTNIMTQRYAGRYASYHPQYAKWKQARTSNFPGYWVLSGRLVGSLTSMRLPHGKASAWFGGVQPGALGERGRPIALYGSAGEFSFIRPNQPARPVFTPTMEDYAKDPSGWMKRGNETTRAVRNAWS